VGGAKGPRGPTINEDAQLLIMSKRGWRAGVQMIPTSKKKFGGGKVAKRVSIKKSNRKPIVTRKQTRDKRRKRTGTDVLEPNQLWSPQPFKEVVDEGQAKKMGKMMSGKWRNGKENVSDL